MDRRSRSHHNELLFNDGTPYTKQIVAKMTNKNLDYPATYQSLFTHSMQYSFLFQPEPMQHYVFSDVLAHCFFEVVTSGQKDGDGNVTIESKIYSQLRFNSENELIEFINKNVTNDGLSVFFETVHVNVYLLTKTSDMFVKGRNGLFHSMIGRRTNSSSRYPRHMHNQPEYQFWDSAETYSLNQLVIYDDDIYKSLVPNNNDNEPFAGSGFWQRQLHDSRYQSKAYVTKIIWAYFGIEIDIEDPAVYQAALRAMWVSGNRNTWYSKFGVNHLLSIQATPPRMYWNNGTFTVCGSNDFFQTTIEHHVVAIDNSILNDGTSQPGTGRLNGACRVFPHLSYNDYPIEQYPIWNLGENGPYALDSIVRYGRQIYQSLAVGNTQTPGAHPYWEASDMRSLIAPTKKMFEHIQSMFVVTKIIYNSDPNRFALFVKPAGMDTFNLTIPLTNMYASGYNECQFFIMASGIGKSTTIVKIPNVNVAEVETTQRTGVVATFNRLSFFHYLVPVKARSRGALHRNILKILIVKNGYAMETKNNIRLVTNNLSKFELLT